MRIKVFFKKTFISILCGLMTIGPQVAWAQQQDGSEPRYVPGQAANPPAEVNPRSARADQRFYDRVHDVQGKEAQAQAEALREAIEREKIKTKKLTEKEIRALDDKKKRERKLRQRQQRNSRQQEIDGRRRNKQKKQAQAEEQSRKDKHENFKRAQREGQFGRDVEIAREDARTLKVEQMVSPTGIDAFTRYHVATQKYRFNPSEAEKTALDDLRERYNNPSKPVTHLTSRQSQAPVTGYTKSGGVELGHISPLQFFDTEAKLPGGGTIGIRIPVADWEKVLALEPEAREKFLQDYRAASPSGIYGFNKEKVEKLAKTAGSKSNVFDYLGIQESNSSTFKMWKQGTYKEELQKEGHWQEKIHGATARMAHHTGDFVRETGYFYAAMGVHATQQLFFSMKNGNPAALEQWYHHITDPIGAMGFAAFVATNRAVGATLMKVKSVLDMYVRGNLRYALLLNQLEDGKIRNSPGSNPLKDAKATLRRTGLFGGNPLAHGAYFRASVLSRLSKVTVKLIPALGMSLGMTASGLFEEYMHDVNVKECHKLTSEIPFEARTVEEHEDVRNYCDRAYWNWTVGEKVYQLKHSMVGMVVSAMISGGIGTKKIQMLQRAWAWSHDEDLRIDALRKDEGHTQRVARNSKTKKDPWWRFSRTQQGAPGGSDLKMTENRLSVVGNAGYKDFIAKGKNAVTRAGRTLIVWGVRYNPISFQALTPAFSFGFLGFLTNMMLFFNANGVVDYYAINPLWKKPDYAERAITEMNQIYQDLEEIVGDDWINELKRYRESDECAAYFAGKDPGNKDCHLALVKRNPYGHFTKRLRDLTFHMDNYRQMLLSQANISMSGWQEHLKNFLYRFKASTQVYREVLMHINLEKKQDELSGEARSLLKSGIKGVKEKVKLFRKFPYRAAKKAVKKGAPEELLEKIRKSWTFTQMLQNLSQEDQSFVVENVFTDDEKRFLSQVSPNNVANVDFDESNLTMKDHFVLEYQSPLKERYHFSDVSKESFLDEEQKGFDVTAGQEEIEKYYKERFQDVLEAMYMIEDRILKLAEEDSGVKGKMFFQKFIKQVSNKTQNWYSGHFMTNFKSADLFEDERYELIDKIIEAKSNTVEVPSFDEDGEYIFPEGGFKGPNPEIDILVQLREYFAAADMSIPFRDLNTRPHDWLNIRNVETKGFKHIENTELKRRLILVQRGVSILQKLLLNSNSPYHIDFKNFHAFKSQSKDKERQKNIEKEARKKNFFLDAALTIGQITHAKPGFSFLDILANDASLSSQEEEAPFPEKVGYVKTPKITDYLLAQMLCGPHITQEEQIGNYGRNPISDTDYEQLILTLKWTQVKTFEPPRVIKWDDSNRTVCERFPVQMTKAKKEYNKIYNPHGGRLRNHQIVHTPPKGMKYIDYFDGVPISEALWEFPMYDENQQPILNKDGSPKTELLDAFAILRRYADPELLGVEEAYDDRGGLTPMPTFTMKWNEHVLPAFEKQVAQFAEDYMEYIDHYFYDNMANIDEADVNSWAYNLRHPIQSITPGVNDGDSPVDDRHSKGVWNSIYQEAIFHTKVLNYAYQGFRQERAEIENVPEEDLALGFKDFKRLGNDYARRLKDLLILVETRMPGQDEDEDDGQLNMMAGTNPNHEGNLGVFRVKSEEARRDLSGLVDMFLNPYASPEGARIQKAPEKIIKKKVRELFNVDRERGEEMTLPREIAYTSIWRLKELLEEAYRYQITGNATE